MQKIILVTWLFFSLISYSQDHIIGDPVTFNKSWIIKFGVNAVDNSGKWKPFEFLSDESTSAFSNPLALGIERRFTNANSISLFGSINKWKANKGIIDGILLTDDRSYAAVDLSYKFYFEDYLFNANWLDLYIEGGAGLYFTSENGPFSEKESGISQNIGVGSTIWFSKSIGFNIQAISKFSRKDGNTRNHIQYFAGLTLKLTKEDFDQDGIRNDDDLCPYVYGLALFNGCPDSDGDGIEDAKDSCPNLAGKIDLNGCPDADNDGVRDAIDKCPNEFGVLENEGCPIPEPQPEPVLPKKEVLAPLNEYAETILFDYSKASFKQDTYTVLLAINAILKDYPDSHFIIEGHTDSLGSRTTNQNLSEYRANAVRDYFISNGIDPSRLSAYGFGEDRPKYSNKTKGGRDHNRRVEVRLKK